MTDESYMKEALREARAADSEGEIPIGAVIVCNDRIIARGHNMTERLNDPTAHAEMIALTAATEAFGGKYLTGCTIYVTVEPCPMCAAALNWAQISKVIWGADDPKRGFTLFSAEAENEGGPRRGLLHPKTETASGILAEDCSLLLTEFFRRRR